MVDSVLGWIGLCVLASGAMFIVWCLLWDDDAPRVYRACEFTQELIDMAAPETSDDFIRRPGARAWWYRGWELATADDFEGVMLWGPMRNGKHSFIGFADEVGLALAFVDIQCEGRAQEYAR